MRAAVVVAAAVLWCGLGSATAGAQTFEQTLQLGAPGRPARVRVVATDDEVALQVGRHEHPLPFGSAPEVRAELLELRGGARVAVLRMRSADREMAALVGRGGPQPRVLWTGTLTPTGDPGERRTDILRVEDLDGDGAPEVVVGAAYEGIFPCGFGQEDTMLDARVLDPDSLELRPVSFAVPAPRGKPIETGGVAPEIASPEPRLLTPVAVSSGSDGALGMRLRARVLADGDLTSGWSAGPRVRGEFAVFRWDGGRFPIRAIALTLAADTPTRLRLTTDTGDHIDTSVPASGDGPVRHIVTPAVPLATRCVSVTMLDAPQPGASAPRLLQVEGFSELNTGAAAQTLVAALSEPGDTGDAARLLGQLGPAALPPLVGAFAGLPKPAKRHALRIAGRLPAMPEAQGLLAEGARDAAPEVRADAMEFLIAAGEPLAETRKTLMQDPKLTAGLATQIARRGTAAMLPELLANLPGASGDARPALREAIARSTARHGTPALAAAEAWASSEPQEQSMRLAQAQLALSLSSQPPARALCAKLVERHLRTDAAGDFELLWYLIAAAERLPAEAGVDGVLQHLTVHDERWMVREAALRALIARRSPGLEGTARGRLRDPYPRVRVTALAALGLLGAAEDAVITHAERDRWHLVRRAALEALGDSPKARAAMLGRLRDRNPNVRAMAITSLSRIRAVDRWKSVEPRVAADDEYPQVISAGIKMAHSLCIMEAGETLEAVVERGFAPDAWDPDRELALEALSALAHLRGRAAVQPLAALGGPRVAAEFAADERDMPACEPSRDGQPGPAPSRL